MKTTALAASFLLAFAATAPAQDIRADMAPLLPQVRQLGAMAWRATFEMEASAFSPDGKTLALGGNGSLGLWDVATGQQIATFNRSGCGYFWSLAWAPDGTLYAGGQHNDVMRCDVKAKKIAQDYPWHKFVIRRISLSADGRTLASLDVDKKVAVWRMPQGKVMRSFVLDSDANWPDIALSPDGKLLAMTGKGKRPVVIRDVDTGAERRVLGDGANPQFLKIEFTRDGKRLVGGEHGALFVWNVPTGKLLHRMNNVNEDHVEGMAVAPDGKSVAVVGWREGVHVWDVDTGKLRRTLIAPGERLKTVAFSPDGKSVAAGGVYNAIHRWNVETGARLDSFDGHLAGVEGVAWPQPGRLVTAGLDRSIRIWDPNSGKLLKTVVLDEGIRPREFSADASLLLSASSERIRIIETATGKERCRLDTRTDWGDQLAFAPDGSWFAHPGKDRKGIQVRRTTGGPWHFVTGSDRPFAALAASPDGTLLAAGAEQRFNGEVEPSAEPFGAVRRPESRKLPTVFLYDAKTGKERARFGPELSSVCRLAFSPDGHYLAVADLTNRARVYDLRLRKWVAGASMNNTSYTELVFSPDSRSLLALGRSSGAGFDLWEVASMTPIGRAPGHEVQTAVLAFSPDGRTVVSGGHDNLARTWDVTMLAPKGHLSKLKPTATELRHWWDELADSQAAPAHAALWRLVASGDEAVAVLKPHLRPAPLIDAKKLRRWIDQLDDDAFAVRDEAMKQLERLGAGAEEDLRKRLDGAAPIETRRRLEQLIAKLAPSPERLRAHRALMVLEQVATPAAQAVLATVAAGEPRDPLTQEANGSLERLRKK